MTAPLESPISRLRSCADALQPLILSAKSNNHLFLAHLLEMSLAECGALLRAAVQSAGDKNGHLKLI